MREWLRQSLLYSFTLYLTAGAYPGLIIPQPLWSLLWAGVVFALIQIFIRPLIKLVLLPLNLLTLGLLSWLSQVFCLVAAVRLIPGLAVLPLTTTPWQQFGFAVPALTINQPAGYILSSVIINLVHRTLAGVLCRD